MLGEHVAGALGGRGYALRVRSYAAVRGNLEERSALTSNRGDFRGVFAAWAFINL